MRPPYLPFGGVHTSTGALPTARFPGQWFQSESGLHQNWMRDYDPTTGRYLQADPLGLIDGASVYGYAGQSAMMNIDPTGECFGPAAALLPACIIAAYMLYDYLSDDCYTWMDFWYSLASNINPVSCKRFPVLCMMGRGGKGGGGGGPNKQSGAPQGTTAADQPIVVTPEGVALPPDPKYSIPENYVEYPYRSGSYGEVVNGKFVERIRIDPATPTGKPGPEYSHYHRDGGPSHYSPRPGDSDPGFGP